MVLNKLEKATSYKEGVYNELKQAIIGQRLRPEEQLNERNLAEKLGISRTPVREALHMLEKEGWVITEPWKGTYVLDLTEEDIEEVFQLRMALEPLVIELITERLSKENLERLDELYAEQTKYQQCFDADAFISTDRHFHMYLTDLTKNKRLIQILNNLSDMMQRLGIQAVAHQARYQETLDEHARIIAELKKRNLIKARQAMIYHVLRTKEHVYNNRANR